ASRRRSASRSSWRSSRGRTPQRPLRSCRPIRAPSPSRPPEATGMNTARGLLAIGVLGAASLLAAGTTQRTAAATGSSHVAVYFVQGEQLTPVRRRGGTALSAVRQLIAGPARDERVQGFRTYVPASTRVNSVTVANRIATVDLSSAFTK